ncbi:MAG: hypothetical protein K8J31_03070 [Anaerolineae bacterium]|nr:hypothetical protein [Anaerolineae bacterium]
MMVRDIDLTRGGYGGDVIEEDFKWFTSQHMEYWWHFREVLYAADRKSTARWKMIDGSLMSDDDHRTLIAVSLLNYAVYTGMAEAMSFFDDLRLNVSQGNLLYTRRAWKGLYSSLYGSFNAFCNLFFVVVFNESPFGADPVNPWNQTPTTVLKRVVKDQKTTVADVIKACQSRLIIRDHLDHWWAIWTGFIQDKQTGRIGFRLDHNFKKGYILLEAEQEVDWNKAIDAVQRAIDDITGCADDFNRIYKEMAVTGGYLDTYLIDNGWEIDYSDYGSPHNRQRPTP